MHLWKLGYIVRERRWKCSNVVWSLENVGNKPVLLLASLMSKEVQTYVEELHQAAGNQDTCDCWGNFWSTVLHFDYLRDEELDNLLKAQNNNKTSWSEKEVRKIELLVCVILCYMTNTWRSFSKYEGVARTGYMNLKRGK